jgi:hypothetical protein
MHSRPYSWSVVGVDRLHLSMLDRKLLLNSTNAHSTFSVLRDRQSLLRIPGRFMRLRRSAIRLRTYVIVPRPIGR